MELRLDTEGKDGGWVIRLTVGLDRRETNQLFLSGDRLVSWPSEGRKPGAPNGSPPRSSMFLSESVARPGGLELTYESEGLAERAGMIISHQIRSALDEG
jgi:hypothetical protein